MTQQARVGATAPQGLEAWIATKGLPPTSVTSVALRVRKPDHTQVVWSPDVVTRQTDGIYVLYRYRIGDLNVAGRYRVDAALAVVGAAADVLTDVGDIFVFS